MNSVDVRMECLRIAAAMTADPIKARENALLYSLFVLGAPKVVDIREAVPVTLTNAAV